MFICVLYYHSYYCIILSVLIDDENIINHSISLLLFLIILISLHNVLKKNDAYMGNIFGTLAARRSS